ncbi:MAG: glycosyltransferase family 39 protein [Caulobacteraceae bacterium]|nr:glycosyltransferase family 39 protein [Caulobacteraceae bacterium]
MTQETRLDSIARGWRAPLLAALVALLAGLPGLFALPPLDRDESLFAQATVQMLESGDFVSIRYQDHPRDKKPVAINWLQAASVSALSSVEARQIWAFRIPSLLGAMLAAAALAWGVMRFFGAGTGLAAGAIFASTLLLSTEAGIAKTDAVLCGATTLAMAALARLYAAWNLNDGVGAGRRTKLLFWLGLALGVLDKGPIGPMVALLAGLTLWAWDRKAPWARTLGWGWGLMLILLVAAPWAVAITVKTDGQFWTGAIGGDLAPKLARGDAGHGAPPGYHSLLAIILFFPATALLPAALVQGWKGRAEAGVRFAVAWLVPTWLVFELLPTKLPHYPMPAYGALAWLAAVALTRPIGRPSAWIGAGLSVLVGVVFAAVAGVAQARYGEPAGLGWAILAGALGLLAGLAGAAIPLAPSRRGAVLAAAIALGIAAHAALAAGLAPRLGDLWLSRRTMAALDHVRLDPRGGLIPGPVAVVGYAEPSLVFSLGTETEFAGIEDAAEAVSEGRPVVVEQRQDQAFRDELAADGLKATAVGTVSGLDYSKGKALRLILYRSDSPPQPDDQDTGPDQGGAP